jgi:hypothetical protein
MNFPLRPAHIMPRLTINSGIIVDFTRKSQKHLVHIVFFAIFAPSLVSPAMGRRAVLLYEKVVFERGKHLSKQEFPPVNCDSHDILRVLSVLQLDSTNNLFILIKTS